MRWRKKENKFLWSKESDKRSALYTNLCILRRVNPNIIVEVKCDRVSRELCRLGNEEVANRKWTNAIHAYSQSLCYAESLERMSYGFAKRGYCFLNLKLYELCLVDIKLAKEFKYTNIAELEKYEKVCMNEFDTASIIEKHEPELSFPSHEQYPGLAETLSINWNHEYGFHFVANEDIDVGSTVLIEKGFTIISTGSEQRCSKCFKTQTNLVPCKKCTRAMFCFDSCEKCEIHDLECGLQLPRVYSLIKEDFLPVLRSIVVAISIFPNANELKDFVESVISDTQIVIPNDSIDDRSRYKIILRHFDPNYPDSSNTTKGTIQCIYETIMAHRPIGDKFKTKHLQRFLMHLIGHHISIRKNLANGCEHRKKMITPVIGSYFNHSCSPNALMLSCNGILVTTICRPIRAGEQICIGYMGTKYHCPFIQRQEIIEDKFSFKCKCERCVLEVTDSLTPTAFLDNETRKILDNCSEEILYTREKRHNIMNLCLRLLKENGRITWCEDLSKVLGFYLLLLHSKFALGPHF